MLTWPLLCDGWADKTIVNSRRKHGLGWDSTTDKIFNGIREELCFNWWTSWWIMPAGSSPYGSSQWYGATRPKAVGGPDGRQRRCTHRPVLLWPHTRRTEGCAFYSKPFGLGALAQAKMDWKLLFAFALNRVFIHYHKFFSNTTAAVNYCESQLTFQLPPNDRQTD